MQKKKRGNCQENAKKSLNFILNLEKSKAKNNAITRLVQIDGAIVKLIQRLLKKLETTMNTMKV